MTKQIALVGSLTDIRNYGENKSIILRVEVPAELADEVLAAFKWPTRVNPVAVAIVKLDLTKAVSEPAKAQDEPMQTREQMLTGMMARVRADQPGELTPIKPKRAWGDLTPAQQAGIRCNEKAFQDFLAERCGEPVVGPDGAASVVRLVCGVRSRAELEPGSVPAGCWHQLDGDYEIWLKYGAAA